MEIIPTNLGIVCIVFIQITQTVALYSLIDYLTQSVVLYSLMSYLNIQ